jgi:hypothetical protein
MSTFFEQLRDSLQRWIQISTVLAACLLTSACQHFTNPCVTGVLKDKISGLPVPDVELRTISYERRDSHTSVEEWVKTGGDGVAVTDSEGRFTLNVHNEGRYSLEANPNTNVWTEPNYIEVEIPAPRHPLYIDLLKGPPLDLGIVYAKFRKQIESVYGLMCEDLGQQKQLNQKLDFELLVLQRNDFSKSWHYEEQLERGLHTKWRADSPTLVCIERSSEHEGVYVEKGSSQPDRADSISSIFSPNRASTENMRVIKLDRKGVSTGFLSASPPAETTSAYDASNEQDRFLRSQLLDFVNRK